MAIRTVGPSMTPAGPGGAASSLNRVVNTAAGTVAPAGLDELDAGHGRVVTVAGAQLENPRVAARTIGVAGTDVGEQLVGHVLVPDEGHDEALVVHAHTRVSGRLLGLGHALLHHRAERLGLGHRRGDAL